jgi:hypothetical protein
MFLGSKKEVMEKPWNRRDEITEIVIIRQMKVAMSVTLESALTERFFGRSCCLMEWGGRWCWEVTSFSHLWKTSVTIVLDDRMKSA